MADLYGAIRDAAVNRLISALMAFRPSLFNYAAPSWAPVDPKKGLAATKQIYLACFDPGLALAADPNSTPRFTKVPWLPAPGLGGSIASLQLPWCFQISSIQIDFHPTDQIKTLPPELSPPLAAHRFALMVGASFGIGCPPPDLVESMLGPNQDFTRRNPVIPVTKLQCFQLQLYVLGHLEKLQTGTPPVDTVGMQLDGLEVVDLQPAGMEAAVECYLRTLIQVVVLPRLRLALERIVVKALGMTIATVVPTLATDVPVNPEIEKDELRVWVNVTIL